MNKNLYAMFDKQANAYMAPIHLETDAEAIRLFTTWVNEDNKQSNVSLYPEHFSLWRLGSYDTASGNLNTDQKELITGNACKKGEQAITLTKLMQMIEERISK